MKYAVIAVIMLGLMASGCGRKASEKVTEKMIEAQMAKQGVKGHVDLSNNKITVQTQQGTATYAAGKGVKVPDNFPNDVFVYDGATVLSSVMVPQGCNLVLETAAEATTVAEAYKNKMFAAGWKSQMEMNQGEQIMNVFQKEQRNTSIVISRNGQKTQIALTTTGSK